MKLVTQHSDWSSSVRQVAGQSTNMADSVEESTIPEKEVTEDVDVAQEKEFSVGKKIEVNCGSPGSSMPLELTKVDQELELSSPIPLRASVYF